MKTRWIALLLVAGCTPGMEPPGSDSLMVLAGNNQTATVATAVTVDPLVVVRDGNGTARRNVPVRFSVGAGSGWVTVDSLNTDSLGRASTRWYLGPRPGAHSLRVQAVAQTVTLNATASALQPGTTLFGRNQYIEFRVGDLPLIFSAPHGGTLLPEEIPDRTVGETVRDSNTDEVAEDVGDAFASSNAGHRPHIVIARLHRRKLDANREIGEAAQGNAFAEIAWREFHGFLEAARATFNMGILIDIHGHGHPTPRLELGYLLTGAQLSQPDAQLNTLASQTSVRGLAERRQLPLVTVLRGPQSLGTLLTQQSYAAVPSATIPNPGGESFFSGGYITERYGSLAGGNIDAIQIEAQLAGVRDTDDNRKRYAAALANVLNAYYAAHYSPLLR